MPSAFRVIDPAVVTKGFLMVSIPRFRRYRSNGITLERKQKVVRREDFGPKICLTGAAYCRNMRSISPSDYISTTLAGSTRYLPLATNRMMGATMPHCNFLNNSCQFTHYSELAAGGGAGPDLIVHRVLYTSKEDSIGLTSSME